MVHFSYTLAYKSFLCVEPPICLCLTFRYRANGTGQQLLTMPHIVARRATRGQSPPILVPRHSLVAHRTISTTLAATGQKCFTRLSVLRFQV